MNARTLTLAAVFLGLLGSSGCWIFEGSESGGSLCTGGPVTLAVPIQLFCGADRITGTVTGPDMTTVEVSIDPANPTVTLEIPSGEDRELVVRVYTSNDPDTPAVATEPLLFCVDAGQPVSATVTVTESNRNPTIAGVTPSGSQVTAGQAVALTAQASDPDACDAVRSYAWSTDYGTITGSGAGASWVPQCPSSAGASCTAIVGLTVFDRRGGKSSQSFTYTIGSGNGAPTVSLAAADGLFGDCWGVSLTATASDPNGDALTLSWSIVSGPGSLTDVSGTADTTAIWDSGCTTGAVDTVVQVTATDSSGASATATVNIVNHVPTVSVNAAWNLNTCISPLTASASDADGDALSYFWEVIAGTGTLSPTSGSSVTYSETACTIAPITVRVTVTDDRGATATADATYTPGIVN